MITERRLSGSRQVGHDPEFRLRPGADVVAGCSQLAGVLELLAQDLLDAGDCFVDRLLGAYLGGRAAQQLLGNLGHRGELFPRIVA
jgi:hypothetical protein